ncbi:MAG: hypothetical protein V3U02_02370 [Calditrichia bacterium]
MAECTDLFADNHSSDCTTKPPLAESLQVSLNEYTMSTDAVIVIPNTVLCEKEIWSNDNLTRKLFNCQIDGEVWNLTMEYGIRYVEKELHWARIKAGD